MLYPVCVNGKNGLIDSSGSLAVPPQFEACLAYANGVAPVKMEGRWGLLNLQGEMVVQPVWDSIDKIADGRAAVERRRKFGFIDLVGNVIIEPQYRRTLGFSEGLAAVFRERDEVEYIDVQGKTVISSGKGWSGENFSEGLAVLSNGEAYRVIDPSGTDRLYFSTKWQPGSPASDLLEVLGDFHGGLAYAARPKMLEGYGFIGKQGAWKIEPQFSLVDDFHEGLAAVNKNDKWGYADETGKLVIECKYELAEGFSEGLAAVQIDDLWGVIDRSGKMVVTPKFSDGIDSFQDGAAAVWHEEHGEIKVGYIDRSGKWIWKPTC